ncbi:hypothetical protein K432DRAFT_270532, partial [Lepidopterella palustris CBS 459.81]
IPAANIQQLFVKLSYQFYNDVITSTLQCKERASYTLKCVPLRVSEPQGAQKSTYYLQLPYRYTILLPLSSSLMYWLTWQCIIVSSIAIHSQSVLQLTFFAFGYSIALLGVLLVFILWALLCKYVACNPPLVGSYSLAISAVCHARKD